jgi:DHA1 family tetracycline resistance protein-like MFS transporter
MTENTPLPEDKLDFKRVLPIFVIVFIDLLGFTIIIPLLPLYSTAFGLDAFWTGVLGASYPFMQFAAAPILGALSDRFGRRPVLIISQIGTFLGFILLGLATNIWMLFISRIIDGISGANISTAQAAITDSTNEKNRTQGLGLIGAAFGLGFTIGPVIAFIVLASTDNNYSAVAYVAAFFSLISILLTFFWLEETLPPEKRGQIQKREGRGLASILAALKRPQIGLLLALMFMQQFAFGGYEHMLALFTLNRLGMNASGNAALFVFIGVIVVAVQGGLVGRWSKKFGDRWVILMGLLVLTVGMVASAVTPRVPPPWYSQAELKEELSSEAAQEIQIDLPPDDNIGWTGLIWLMAASVPIAIGGGVLMPAVNSMITKTGSQENIGSLLGTSSSMQSIANFSAPLVMGFIFQQFGSTMPFLLGGMILFGLWFWARGRIVDPQPA